jgi:hypothetical protein
MRAALVLALASLMSCGGSSSTTPVGDPASIELSDDDVTFNSLQATTDLDAVVRDAGGTVIAATVTWTTDASSVASVTNQGVVTAVANGDTRVIATAGPVADTATITVEQVAALLVLSPDTLRLAAVDDTASITATVRDAGGSPMSGVPVTFATEDPDVATVIVATGKVTAEGNGATRIVAQVAPGGSALTKNVRVEVGGSLAPAYLVGGYVNTAYSSQIPAASGGGTFTYAVTGGLLPTGVTMSSSGAITGTPITSGVHFFEVTATSGVLTVSQRYAITISTMPAAAFNLWVAYNGGPMPPVNAQTALTNALDRWEEIITGDAGAPVTYSANAFPAAGCTTLVDGTLYNGAFIEDVAFIVDIAAIDGPSNTLAQAGPCGSPRPQLPVVVSGQMRIDQADAAGGSATFLRDVIIHEIGHVLGIGTLWQDSTVFFGTDSVSYFGQNAKQEWNTISGEAGNVPVEPEVGAHWDEAWFGAEVMTPSAEGPGSSHPISRVTVGALLDFGWDALLTAADAFTLPGCSPACTVPARAPGERVPIDVVIEPLTPLPPGSLRN